MVYQYTQQPTYAIGQYIHIFSAAAQEGELPLYHFYQPAGAYTQAQDEQWKKKRFAGVAAQPQKRENAEQYKMYPFIGQGYVYIGYFPTRQKT